jgi:co-chaperonin GroES (HSP10)
MTDIKSGVPTPGYVLIKPLVSDAQIVPGLVDMTKQGLDPNGEIISVGNLDSYPDYKGTLDIGKRIVVPKHVVQLVKFQGEDYAIVHCTDIKLVF